MIIKSFHERLFLIIISCVLFLVETCNGGQNEEKNREIMEKNKKLKEASLKILPEAYQNIWIGMGEQKFIKARPGARFQADRSDPDERKWYKEIDKTGVNVWYGIDRKSETLAVIQFANSLPSWRMFNEHATLMLEKYGTDYELYHCPSGDPKFKMTRLLFAKHPISIMEAVLESETNIAVTMVISSLADARRAIERQKCFKIDKEAAMENWIQEKLAREQKIRTKTSGEKKETCDKNQ